MSNQLKQTQINMRILILLAYYLPGYKAGGPIRTISNVVERLHTEFDFLIVTRDRDANDKTPYAGIQLATWQKVGNAHVYYLPQEELTSIIGLFRHIRDFEYDAVYLNSYFNTTSILYLWLRRLQLVPKKPLIIAPRGELNPGALSLKPMKKRLYIQLAKILGLYGEGLWQASSEYEEHDITVIYPSATVHIAPDMPPLHLNDNTTPSRIKHSGSAKIVYLARITPKKQLHLALDLLSQITKPVRFDIYGPIDDNLYWRKCQQRMAALPANITVNYLGSITHQQVQEVLQQYHLLFLPTLAENYGHVIVEALSAGCPVLISSTTPWRNLEALGIGWDVELNDSRTFLKILRGVIWMNESAFQELSSRAHDFGQTILESTETVEANRALFNYVMRH